MRSCRPLIVVLLVALICMINGQQLLAAEPLITNIFYNTFIVDALNDISAQAGVTIIPDSTISGYINLELVDVPLSEALSRICTPLGLTFKYLDEGYYLVGAADVKSQAFWLLSETKVINIRYRKAENVVELLSDYYQPFIRTDYDNNAIIASASPEVLRRIEKEITVIDLPVTQVMIEVLVTELSTNARKTLGTEWQWYADPEGGHSSLGFSAQRLTSRIGYSQADYVRQFLMSLKTLVDDGEAWVHANPRIATLNGKEAEIVLGQEQTFMISADETTATTTTTSTQRINTQTGVSLKFMPHISPWGDITLKIEPEVSMITGSNEHGFPIVVSRNASTTIRVQDGETFILGGLLQEFENKSASKVPLLGDLPILGRLFRSERTEKKQTEVLIVVTPTIIRPEEQLKNEASVNEISD